MGGRYGHTVVLGRHSGQPIAAKEGHVIVRRPTLLAVELAAAALSGALVRALGRLARRIVAPVAVLAKPEAAAQVPMSKITFLSAPGSAWAVLLQTTPLNGTMGRRTPISLARGAAATPEASTTCRAA